MRLEQITYFLRVAEHGNITAAAKSLYIFLNNFAIVAVEQSQI